MVMVRRSGGGEMAEFKVLIPLDGSPLAEQSLSYLPALQQFHGAELMLLSVVDDSEDFGALTSQEAIEREVNVMAAYLKEVRRDIQGWLKVSINAKVARGPAAASILNEASAYQADLIIISTHGRSGVSRWRFGSVADKVIRGAESAGSTVLVIGPNVTERDGWRHAESPALFKSILVPLDGSPLAEAALMLAERYVEIFGSQLHLVRAVAMPILSDGFANRVSYTPDLLDHKLEEAKRYLTTCAGRLRSANNPIVEVLTGPAAMRLQDYIADQNIDLVIVTSHGRGGILRTALGSVTDRLLGGNAPVIVVPTFADSEPHQEGNAPE
jgi:nucleotide-binding universal stress UspA family protein